jgi:uncharacterized protein (DUF1810 family)
MDPYRLERFVTAQDCGGTYAAAVSELRAGLKTGHWMWFVFPQLAGLGRSATAREFAISSIDEARAYLRHPVLGPRLADCARILAGSSTASGPRRPDGPAGPSAADILGPVDAVKLRSSMTLFMAADPAEPVFAEVLARYFAGVPDEATTRLL